MQTFLPYSDFLKSAQVLDRQRLGKQRVECKQIYAVLDGKSIAWANHPAVKMWIGCKDALAAYMDAIIAEWVRRGYVNNIIIPKYSFSVMPDWLGSERFHSSHRAALLAKNHSHYSQFGWSEKPIIDYYWPKGRGE